MLLPDSFAHLFWVMLFAIIVLVKQEGPSLRPLSTCKSSLISRDLFPFHPEILKSQKCHEQASFGQ